MSEATIYDEADVGGPGAGTAVAPLDFCGPCHAGDHVRCERGDCECDGLCATRAAKEASNEQA